MFCAQKSVRCLIRTMSNRSDKPLILVPGPMRIVSETANSAERRKAIRYPFTAEAEAVEVRSQTRVAGRASDLGLGGCYIDTISPLAVGTVVRLRMKREQHVFEATATVVYAHVSMGMGLAFTEIKSEYQAVLRTWVAELSGEQVVEPEVEVVDTEPESSEVSTILNLQQVLNELVKVMVRKKILNETEATTLLRQIFR
jgi:hypothetical protein